VEAQLREQLRKTEASQLYAEANLRQSSLAQARLRQKVDAIKAAEENADAQLHILQTNMSLEDARVKQISDERTRLYEQVEANVAAKQHEDAQLHALNAAKNVEEMQLNRSLEKTEQLRRQVKADKQREDVLQKKGSAETAAKLQDDVQLKAVENKEAYIEKELNRSSEKQEWLHQQLQKVGGNAASLQNLRGRFTAVNAEKLQDEAELNSSLAKVTELRSEIASTNRNTDSQMDDYKALTIVACFSVALVAALIAVRCDRLRNKKEASVDFTMSSQSPLLGSYDKQLRSSSHESTN
jgi:chromosome segregation ATPase